MVLSRRALLHGAGVSLVGSVTGCAGLGTTPQLGQLGVTNYDTRSHAVHVLLFEGESLVYWTSKRVPPAEGDVLGTAVFEGYPSEPDPGRLLVRLDGQSLVAAERFDFAEYDVDCLGLQLEIGEEGRSPELSIWYTAGSDVCEAADDG